SWWTFRRRGAGAAFLWGEGEGTAGGGPASPRRPAPWGTPPPMGEAPRSYNSAETSKWPLAARLSRAPRCTASPILARRATFVLPRPLRCALSDDRHTTAYRSDPRGH